jgi:hypothetical protein
MLNLNKLKEEACSNQLYQEMSNIFQTLPDNIDNIQKEWEIFKTSTLGKLKQICGTRKQTKRNQRTIWREEIQNDI